MIICWMTHPHDLRREGPLGCQVVPCISPRRVVLYPTPLEITFMELLCNRPMALGYGLPPCNNNKQTKSR